MLCGVPYSISEECTILTCWGTKSEKAQKLIQAWRIQSLEKQIFVGKKSIEAF